MTTAGTCRVPAMSVWLKRVSVAVAALAVLALAGTAGFAVGRHDDRCDQAQKDYAFYFRRSSQPSSTPEMSAALKVALFIRVDNPRCFTPAEVALAKSDLESLAR
jgi:hypothetical protein